MGLSAEMLAILRGENSPTQASNITHCGTIAIVGRPNVGKSSLLNSLIGQKVSITSRKAQTTRHSILGVLTREPQQFLFVDTPGFQTTHANPLNKVLNRTVKDTMSGINVVLLLIEAGKLGAADHEVLKLISESCPRDTPLVVALSKMDTVSQEELLPALRQTMLEVSEVFPIQEIVPVSVRKKPQLDALLDVLARFLPEGEAQYGADDFTDKSERFMAAEFIREKIFRLNGAELPYTTTVVIDQFKDELLEKNIGKKPMKRIAATILVERTGHRAMIIGAGGEKLKQIGTEARMDMEASFGCKVFLELWVKVKSGWADDEAHLRSYGYGN